MIARTQQQNQRFHALIGKLKIDSEHKKELVSAASNGRTESSAELSYPEMEELNEHLQSLINSSPDQQKAARMKKKIFSIFHDLGWEIKGKLDYARINNWMIKSSYLHKFLNDYTAQELPKLVTQVDTMLQKQFSCAK